MGGAFGVLAPPWGDVCPTARAYSLVVRATAGSLGVSATAGSLGVSATAGSLGVSATAGSLGVSATASSLGVSTTASSLGVAPRPIVWESAPQPVVWESAPQSVVNTPCHRHLPPRWPASHLPDFPLPSTSLWFFIYLFQLLFLPKVTCHMNRGSDIHAWDFHELHVFRPVMTLAAR